MRSWLAGAKARVVFARLVVEDLRTVSLELVFYLRAEPVSVNDTTIGKDDPGLEVFGPLP